MKGLEDQNAGNNQASQVKPTQDQSSQGTNMEVQHAQMGMAMVNLETTSQVEETKDGTVIKNSKNSMERVNSEQASEKGETGDLKEKDSGTVLGSQGKGDVEAKGEVRTEDLAEARGQGSRKETVHYGQRKKGIETIAEANALGSGEAEQEEDTEMESADDNQESGTYVGWRALVEAAVQVRVSLFPLGPVCVVTVVPRSSEPGGWGGQRSGVLVRGGCVVVFR
ncbi:hypothetical protein U1Q18_046634 [Sarracenia purpurea var. burkii]